MSPIRLQSRRHEEAASWTPGPKGAQIDAVNDTAAVPFLGRGDREIAFGANAKNHMGNTLVLWKTCSHRLGQVNFFFHFFIVLVIILFFIFYHFFIILFFIFYHFLIIFWIIFSSSGAKKNPKNGKLQFSSSFFSFFYHFFIIFLSFLLPVVELMKNDKKWWKMMKNDKQMIKKW